MQSASQVFFNGPNKACLLCHQNSKRLVCKYCYESFHFFAEQNEFKNLMLQPDIQRGLPECDFIELRAIGDYSWPLSNLLSGLKFENRLIHAKAIADLFAEKAIAHDDVLPENIIPIPLGPRRYARRMFNQALEIASLIGKALNVSVQSRTLIRVKNSIPQTTLTAAQRRKNLKHTFNLQQPINAKHIAIFDDVVTTGATAQSAYTLIKQHYPDIKIDIWAAAITRRR